MNNPQDAIDRVLSGLRDAPVPQGLESRILDALEDATAPQPVQRRFRPLAWAGAAACAFIAIGAAALFFTFSPATHQIPATRVASTTAGQSHENPFGAQESATSPAAPVPASGKHAAPRLRRTTSVTSTRVEARELDHVNLPPPPLPLTREERLLLEITHRRPPFELAMLTSAQNAAQDQHERKEFDQFFALSETQMEIEKLNNAQPAEQGKR